MVEIKVVPGMCKGRTTGDLDTIAAELGMGIGAIYQSIKTTEGEAAAELFRMNLLIVIEPESPVWEPDEGMVVIARQ